MCSAPHIKAHIPQTIYHPLPRLESTQLSSCTLFVPFLLRTELMVFMQKDDQPSHPPRSASKASQRKPERGQVSLPMSTSGSPRRSSAPPSPTDGVYSNNAPVSTPDGLLKSVAFFVFGLACGILMGPFAFMFLCCAERVHIHRWRLQIYISGVVTGLVLLIGAVLLIALLRNRTRIMGF